MSTTLLVVTQNVMQQTVIRVELLTRVDIVINSDSGIGDIELKSLSKSSAGLTVNAPA
jgi:hypothetical protein